MIHPPVTFSNGLTGRRWGRARGVGPRLVTESPCPGKPAWPRVPTLLNQIVDLLLGGALLAERLDVKDLAGAVAVALGIYVVQRAR